MFFFSLHELHWRVLEPMQHEVTAENGTWSTWKEIQQVAACWMFEKLNSCDLESSKFRGKKSLQIHLRFIHFTRAGHSLFSFGIFVLDVCHFLGSEQSTARTVQPQQKPLLTRRTLLFCSRTVLQHKNVSWRWKLCCVCFSLSSAANLINTAKFAFRLPVCHHVVDFSRESKEHDEIFYWMFFFHCTSDFECNRRSEKGREVSKLDVGLLIVCCLPPLF